LKTGYRVILIMLGTFVVWAVTWPLAEGTYVQGELAYTARPIDLNHRDGGRVTRIDVELGDYVEQDDPLLVFDTSEAESQLEIVEGRLARLTAEKRRRDAEVNRMASIDWSGSDGMAIPQRIKAQEATRFQERRRALQRQQSVQRSRISQIRDSIAGLERQLKATRETQSSVLAELSRIEALAADELIARDEVLSRRRQASQIERDIASLESQLASQRERIEEITFDLAQIEGEYTQTAIERLAELDSEIEELNTQRRTYQRRIDNAVLRAPADGWIDDLSVAVVGETVRAGDSIVQFVPDAGQFMVTAQLSPVDVDSVKVGQSTTLEFSTFSRRNPPRVDGRLEQVSAGALQDPNSGQSYYRVRVEILPGQPAFQAIRDDVRVGMPVQTLIKSGERTFAQYIIDPFVDLTRGAFHE
jgi:epimerase transport system membrane fusion protein